MWFNNVNVSYYYAGSGAQSSFAILTGVSGWQRVRPGSPDGVTNVGLLLAAAKAHARKVSVYINGGQIENVMLS